MEYVPICTAEGQLFMIIGYAVYLSYNNGHAFIALALAMDSPHADNNHTHRDTHRHSVISHQCNALPLNTYTCTPK